MEDPLMEVRAILTTTTNATGGLAGVGGGAEIQKHIDTMIADTINRGVDFSPLVVRKPINQLTYLWNLRSDLQSTTAVTFQATEGQGGTPYFSTKYQLYAQCKSLRSDYEVTNIMIAGSSSYYSALADEAKCALDNLKLYEERCIINGTDTSAYGLANGYAGLRQTIGTWYDSNGGDTESSNAAKMQDVTAKYGITPDGNYDILDPCYVAAGTIGASGATGVLELAHMDEIITRTNKKGAKDHERIFLMSEERTDEVNQLLQPQQRFAGTLNLEGGFTVTTYKGIPIIGSRYMDKLGITNTTSDSAGNVALTGDTDNAMYLVDLNMVEFRILAGVDAQHVPVGGAYNGSAMYNRADTQGGFFKTYGTFACKAFNCHGIVWNLTAP